MRSPAPTRARWPALVPLALLALAGLPWPTANAQAAGAVALAEILPDPDAGQREFVELLNAGDAPLDLAGWKLRDAAGNQFTFPSWTLEPGTRVVVWGGGEPTAAGPAWSASTVWNNGGDSATLLDPNGAVAGWLAYGTGTFAAPPGWESMPRLPAPAKGRSLYLTAEGAWQVGHPTPGTAVGAQAGAAEIVVANVAPEARLDNLPPSVRPGATLQVGGLATDANGDGDVASWTLSTPAGVVASGTGAAVAAEWVAPDTEGDWTLVLAVADAGGLTGSDEATVRVVAGDLALLMPEGGKLLFPDLVPGARNVTSAQAFTLHNQADRALAPVFEASPFQGAAGTIGAAGNLSLLVDDGQEVTELAYEGGLLALPSLAAGGTVAVQLRVAEVPAPLAVGTYGTSFTVVA